METKNETPRKLGAFTAAMLVVATMIGTGVFTTTGFMVKDIVSPTAILVSWLLGGILALCGALVYAELAVLMPKNGGEYLLLSRIYNPLIGFLAGWIAFIVGFSASVASSALAFGIYLQTIFPINPLFAAIALVLVMSVVHAVDVKSGSYVQNIFTCLKILLILVFIGGGLMADNIAANQHVSVNLFDSVTSPAFAVALVFVSFSYSGWNSAIYIAGEVKDPGKKLPLALISGTLIVTILYLGLNLIYLTKVPLEQLSGVLEIGHVTAKYIFGNQGATFMSAVIALGLVSSVGSMIMSGPRIYQKMGEEFKRLAFLSKKSKHGAPVNAIIVQSSLSFLMLLTSSFDQLLKYIGFTLSIMAALTIFGVFIIRRRQPELHKTLPYRTLGYPLTPFLFLGLSLWMIIFSVLEDPVVAVTGIGTLLVGGAVYFLVREEKWQKQD